MAPLQLLACYKIKRLCVCVLFPWKGIINNIMKNIKKSFVANITVSLLLVISYNKNSVKSKNKSDFQVFDLTAYNKYKEIPIALNSDITSEDIIAEINKAWELKLDLEQIHQLEKWNEEEDIVKMKSRLTKIDKLLLNDFENHVLLKGFDHAVDKFKERVHSLELNDFDFSR